MIAQVARWEATCLLATILSQIGKDLQITAVDFINADYQQVAIRLNQSVPMSSTRLHLFGDEHIYKQLNSTQLLVFWLHSYVRAFGVILQLNRCQFQISDVLAGI